ncbi:MAG: hypothetical protein HY898_33225 [Deltaproteobacteria bacterium]|nr:hypothetical protein [Deltaproteobacteria bacterium]
MRRLTAAAIVTASCAWGQSSSAAICDATIHQGPATYYDFADGTGVCGYPAETGNQMVVALDAPELAATAMCGACIHIWGPSGEVTVLVVNGCPGCEVGHLDLSPQAYALIASGYNGVPPITWQYVPCDVTGPIRYAYYAGSTTSWAWVQVRNHRHPIASFEARMTDGNYAPLERADWGYFKGQNLPSGTQSYRVTDIYGQVLEDTAIPVLDQGEVEGKGQFPACTGVDGGAHPGSDASTAHDSATTSPDSGSNPQADGGANGPGADGGAALAGQDDGGGCGCVAGPGRPDKSAMILLAFAGLLLCRRVRSSSGAQKRREAALGLAGAGNPSERNAPRADRKYDTAGKLA